MKLKVGDIVSRDGSDEHEVISIDDEGYAGEFRCTKAPASGWIVVGEIEYNLARRYSIIRAGCRAKLAAGQHWAFCGETDMGQSLPALCTACGGEFKRA